MDKKHLTDANVWFGWGEIRGRTEGRGEKEKGCPTH